MTPRKSTFSDEFGIIPGFMVPVAIIGFACIMFLFLNVMPLHDPHSPPFPARLALGVLCGSVLAAYLMLVGYVNQDAKRRDMGQVLWTFLVILIPNGIGFLAYFLLRKPVLEGCPKCGSRVERGFHFCPKCGCGLAPACSHCGQVVQRDFAMCPYCGKALTAQKA